MNAPAVLLEKLGPEQRAHLDWQHRWRATARENQMVEEGDWNECGYLAGRGSGGSDTGRHCSAGPREPA